MHIAAAFGRLPHRILEGVMDIHAIAENWTDVPITAWVLREVTSKADLGRVSLVQGRFVLRLGDIPATAHDGLMECMATASRSMMHNGVVQ